MRPPSLHSICKSLPAPITRCQRRRLGVLAQQLEPATRSRLEPITIQHEHPKTRVTADPSILVSSELTHIRKNMLNMLGSAHPGLSDMAEYYFLHPSKQIRSLLVLLFARATNGLGQQWERKHWDAIYETDSGQLEVLDRPLTLSNILHEWNPNMVDHTESFEHPFPIQNFVAPTLPPMKPSSLPHSLSATALVSPPFLLPTQLRLAQIVEMIHVASTLHEGIVNASEAEKEGFGNKLAILGGDFLLGRASTALSRLGEPEVVELIASVISNLVEGEILSMAEVKTPTLGLIQGPTDLAKAWKVYFQKTYLKTASLMAKGARSAVILGGSREGNIWREVAYAYGRYLGIAYQLAEDASNSQHIEVGMATGPVLFAAEKEQKLMDLIRRNFVEPGDTQLAAEYVQDSRAVERTLLLAESYADKARDALRQLPESEAKHSLVQLTEVVVNRTW